MVYMRVLTVNKGDLETIENYLENGGQGEYETYTLTAVFDNGIEVDVKCCGCQDENEPSWTEAVLFKNGCERVCTEPSDFFLGDWEFDFNGDTYIVEVVLEK